MLKTLSRIALPYEATHSKTVQSYVSEKQAVYCTELATEEKTLFALLPTRRIVPTTITRITASITAYSAMSWPLSSFHKCKGKLNIRTPLRTNFQLVYRQSLGGGLTASIPPIR